MSDSEIQFRFRADELATTVRSLAARGWMPATAGNGSVRVESDPFSFVTTPSGVDKRTLLATDCLRLDEHLEVLNRKHPPRPSAEAALHREIMLITGANAVLHTHSTAGTILSKVSFPEDVEISGYELLKGLAGVTTHKHTEKIPVLENTQEWDTLPLVEMFAARMPEGNLHGFLLKQHGLYSWGRNLGEARRHIEVLEFLMEVEIKASLLRKAGFSSL